MNEPKPEHIAALKKTMGQIMAAVDNLNDARETLDAAKKNRKAPYYTGETYADRLGSVVTMLFVITDLMKVDCTGIDRQGLQWASENPSEGVYLFDWYKQLRDKT